MNNQLTEEDIQHIIRMHDARQRGSYYTSEIVTNIYNKMFNSNANNTNCGSCIRRRIDAIWQQYTKIIDQTTPNNNGSAT